MYINYINYINLYFFYLQLNTGIKTLIQFYLYLPQIKAIKLRIVLKVFIK